MKVLVLLVSFFLMNCGAVEEGSTVTVKVEKENQEEFEDREEQNAFPGFVGETEEIEEIRTEEKETVVVLEETEEQEKIVIVIEELELQLSSFEITTADSAIEDTTPTFTWSESSLQALSLTGSIDYDLSVSSNVDCSNPFQNYEGLTSTSQELDELSEGVHYICLNANGDGKQKEADNSPYTLVIDKLPEAFEIDPVDDATTADEIVVSWSPSVNATSYDLTVGDEVYNTTGNSKELGTLAAGVYAYSVIAKDDEGNTIAGSGSGSFEIIKAWTLTDYYTLDESNQNRSVEFDEHMSNGALFTSSCGEAYFFDEGVIYLPNAGDYQGYTYAAWDNYGCSKP